MSTTQARSPRVDRLGALGAAVTLPALYFAWRVVPRIRRWGATSAEHAAQWPGDELASRPGYVWTNAVTIDRPAHEVWPWVAADLGSAAAVPLRILQLRGGLRLRR